MRISTAIQKSYEYARLIACSGGWSVLYYPLPWEDHNATSGGQEGSPWMDARLDRARARAEIALQLMEYDRTGKSPNATAAAVAVHHAMDLRGLTRLREIVTEALDHLETHPERIDP